MISDTKISLAQFASWLGFDLFKLAGIFKNPNPNLNSVSCECYFQDEALSDGHYSRNELIQLLKYAERFFLLESGLHIAPTQIYDERSKFRKNNYKRVSVKPNFPCGEVIYGKKVLIDQGDVALDKSDIDNIFVTFQTSSTYNKDDIRIFYTESDLIRDCDEIDFNDHRYEIRPYLKIIETSIDEDTKEFSVFIPAYLLVKPSLFDTEVCLEHVADTYVDEVNIYLEKFDRCNEAHYVIYDDECTLDCDEKLYPACYNYRTVGRNKWAVLKPINCIEQDDGSFIYRKYHMSQLPQEVSINYITGSEINCYKMVDDFILSIIGKLSINFISFLKKDCNCSSTLTSKIEYYRKIQKEIEESDSKEYTLDYKIMVDKIGLQLADGLKPTIGIIQAMRDIRSLSCSNEYVGGRYI